MREDRFIWYHASMHTYFHDWRRKAGVATLVLACVFAGMWMRSLFRHDQAALSRGNAIYCFESMAGELDLGRLTVKDNRTETAWWSDDIIGKNFHHIHEHPNRGLADALPIHMN
jgi:hypothetical protein